MTKKYTLTLSKRDLIFIYNALGTTRDLYVQYEALNRHGNHWQARIKRANKLRECIEKLRKEQENG